MPRRITITVEDDIDDLTALHLVYSVVHLGRISNFGKQYCYLTAFKDKLVSASMTRTGNDSFRVWTDETKLGGEDCQTTLE